MSYDAADLWDCQCVLTYPRGFPILDWYETPEKARAAYKAQCDAGRAAELYIRGPYGSGNEIWLVNEGAKGVPLTSQETANGYYHIDNVRARQTSGRFW